MLRVQPTRNRLAVVTDIGYSFATDTTVRMLKKKGPLVKESCCAVLARLNESLHAPLSGMHQVEGAIDFIQLERMRHELVQLHHARHVLIHELRHAVTALPS